MGRTPLTESGKKIEPQASRFAVHLVWAGPMVEVAKKALDEIACGHAIDFYEKVQGHLRWTRVTTHVTCRECLDRMGKHHG